MTITPSDAEVIADAIDSALIDVHVALPGSVQSYDAAKQTATIQLQVKRVLPTDDANVLFATEDLPVLENVPVEFPRTKTFALTFPVKEGDYGLVVFSEMSLDQWRSKGTNTSPGDIGRHTLAGGVFRPGLMPNSEAIGDDIGDDLVLGEIGGVQVRVKPGGVAHVVSAGGPTADDFVAMAGKVDTIMAALDTLFRTTWIVAPTDGGGALKTAYALVDFGAGVGVPPGSVAGSNLKADD